MEPGDQVGVDEEDASCNGSLLGRDFLGYYLCTCQLGFPERFQSSFKYDRETQINGRRRGEDVPPPNPLRPPPKMGKERAPPLPSPSPPPPESASTQATFSLPLPPPPPPRSLSPPKIQTPQPKNSSKGAEKPP